MGGRDPQPYVGPRPYDSDEAGRFFGRARETWELNSLLSSSRLVVLYGPSGVGKTSLLAAGLVPQLHPEMFHVLPMGRPPRLSAFPTVTTPDYNPFTAALLAAWAPDSRPGSLRGMTVAMFLRGVDVGVDRYGERRPLIAIIDQFEEVFTEVPQWSAHRNEFLEQLTEAITEVEHLQLLLSMKNDVVAEILPYESRLSAGHRKRFKLEPLSRDSALEAVNGPLLDTGRSFEDGVAELLVDNLRTTTIRNAVHEERTVVAPTVEPVHLQVVCSALWRALPEDVTVITAEHLQDHGDVKATLTKFCADAVLDLADCE
jgi:hypothetical protein